MSRDAVHIHLGFALLILTIAVTKRKLSDPKVLIPGLILSILMELLDLSDDLSKHNLYPIEYFHDLVNTNFIPVTLVVLCYVGIIRPNQLSDFPS